MIIHTDHNDLKKTMEERLEKILETLEEEKRFFSNAANRNRIQKSPFKRRIA